MDSIRCVHYLCRINVFYWITNNPVDLWAIFWELLNLKEASMVQRSWAVLFVTGLLASILVGPGATVLADGGGRKRDIGNLEASGGC